MNVMIIGEAPGVEEDREGKGFVGDSGMDVLWPEIEKYGYKREDFYISNVNKCYPGKIIKNPAKKHVNACAHWLREEIKEVNPFLILALGNANIKFFTGEDSGITAKAEDEICEWNEEYGAWICWNLHPASTLYNPDNVEIFQNGIKNFCEKIKILGEIPF
jgi:DNA polymerase